MRKGEVRHALADCLESRRYCRRVRFRGASDGERSCRAPGPPPVRTVTAVVLVNGCAVTGVENARLAQAAMNQLVDGCTGFSGDKVQFTATLLPGGAIQFEQRPGASATIPLCVLTPLSHRVRLQKPCSLDVQLEESLVPVSRPADGGT